MKKKYTKRITALAALALFASGANAQVNVFNFNDAGPLGPGTELVVDGTVEVRSAVAGSPTVNVDDPEGGINPVITSPEGTTSTVTTVLGDGSVKSEVSTGGGVTLEKNGNGTFEGGETTTSTGLFNVVTEFEVENIGQPNEGEQVPGSQVWRVEAGGQVIKTFNTAIDKDNYLLDDAQVFADLKAAGLVTDEVKQDDGGDVNVGGILTLAGNADPDNNPETDDGYDTVANVAQTLDSNADSIASNSTDIASNATDIATNKTDIATNKTDIATNKTDIATNKTDIATNKTDIATNKTDIATNKTDIATNKTDIATNKTDIATNKTDIATNKSLIDQEITDRSALIRREADGFIHIGDSSFVLDDQSTDHRLTTNSGEYLVLGGGANGTDVRVDADLNVVGDLTVDALQSSYNPTGNVATEFGAVNSAIASNRKDIETNTRGIAMVAALQHTTVLPGMTNALDVSAAHFEGETGMSINYSRRINENWQINFGAASTTDFDESVIKAGVGVQW